MNHCRACPDAQDQSKGQPIISPVKRTSQTLAILSPGVIPPGLRYCSSLYVGCPRFSSYLWCLITRSLRFLSFPFDFFIPHAQRHSLYLSYVLVLLEVQFIYATFMGERFRYSATLSSTTLSKFLCSVVAIHQVATTAFAHILLLGCCDGSGNLGHSNQVILPSYRACPLCLLSALTTFMAYLISHLFNRFSHLHWGYSSFLTRNVESFTHVAIVCRGKII